MKCKVRKGFFAKVSRDSLFEGFNYVGNFTKINGCEIGLATYIAAHSRIDKAQIGRYCSIGENVKTICGDHPLSYVSTHPAFYRVKTDVGLSFVDEDCFDEYKYVDKRHLFIIGNDVWIGSNASLLQGIRIGNGAVVATGSVVINDVKPFEVVGGVPAKHIKYRFSEDIIQGLLRSKWWMLSIDELSALSQYVRSPNDFIRRVVEHG